MISETLKSLAIKLSIKVEQRDLSGQLSAERMAYSPP